MTQVGVVDTSLRRGIPAPSFPESRKFKPVKWWATIGALFLALETYIFTAWIVSGDATPSPAGPDELPGYMKGFLYVPQLLGPFAVGFFVYWFVIRPWRRDGRLSLDGMFVFGFLLLYWQDPLINYSQTVATYNTHLVNFGSWTAQVPGALAPTSNRMAEPLLYAGAGYVWALFGVIVVANMLVRRAHSRWPQLSRPQLFLLTICGFLLGDLLIETFWVRTGLYVFGGGIRSVSFFGGHWYQYPVYETLLFGTCWGCWACLRYFRDDKGHTIAERGVDEVRATPRQKTWLRFLAICGILNVSYLALYNIPMQWFSLHADPWPQEIMDRSYFVGGVCGQGTDYACSSPDVPIPRPGSQHVRPDGGLGAG